MRVLIGDNVEVIKDSASGTNVITKVFTRKNELIRPTVANIDQLFIVIAISPKPDLLLVDKLCIYCFKTGIEPILVINKTDLINKADLESLKSEYKNVVSQILQTSAENGDVKAVEKLLPNKVSAFAGQSAVGKSSILNAICPMLNQKTNVLSAKVERGKHTTRVCQIFEVNNGFIADTPGFSMLDLFDIEPSDLCQFYPDFEEFRHCKYSNCAHINVNEKVCGVVEALSKQKINENRYERYITLYEKLKQNWESKYD